MVPPESPRLGPPADALIDPPHVLAAVGAVALVRFAGKVSTKPTLVRATEFEFTRVIVSRELVFDPTVDGLKAFDAVGGLSEVHTAEAGPVVPTFAEVMVPVDNVNEPTAVACTATLAVQVLAGGTVAPLSEKVEPPAAAVTVPPHVVEPPGVGALTTLVGNVAENATPVAAVAPWLERTTV
jgi:hypothetical protein